MSREEVLLAGLRRCEAENLLLRRLLQRYVDHSPGIDEDLTTPPLTEEDVRAHRRLYEHIDTILTLRTPKEMHDYVMQLSYQDSKLYDAYRRQYFLRVLAELRDKHNELVQLRKSKCL